MSAAKYSPASDKYEIRQPRNIQEGTQNRVMMMLNYLADGNINEVRYGLIDLLDSLQGELCVTVRNPPVDAALIEKHRAESFKDGYEKGLSEGTQRGRRAFRSELQKALEATP